MMRRLLMCLLLLAGCREIEPVSPPAAFLGYQLEGNVVTSNGFPVQGVDIRLFYFFGTRLPAQDTGRIVVPASVQSIDVFVYDGAGDFVRTFTLPGGVGSLPRNIWDEKDSAGTDVKNGLYTIRIHFDDSFELEYRWLVDARITAVTDDAGRFAIARSSLPIGSIVDHYDSAGVYDGTFDITADIALRASTPMNQRTVFITLEKDQITRITIVM